MKSAITTKAITNASEDTRRLNPDVFSVGKFQPKITQQKAQLSLEGESQGFKKSFPGMAGGRPILRVTLVNFRKRLLDSDNLIGGFKPMRDAIARWLNVDDSDKYIEWEYSQVITKGQTGTAVKIESL